MILKSSIRQRDSGLHITQTVPLAARMNRYQNSEEVFLRHTDIVLEVLTTLLHFTWEEFDFRWRNPLSPVPGITSSRIPPGWAIHGAREEEGQSS